MTPGPFEKSIRFSIHARPSHETNESFWFLFHKDHMAVTVKTEPHAISIPQLATTAASLSVAENAIYYIGSYGNRPCFSADILSASDIPSGLVLYPLRSMLTMMSIDLFSIVGRARQISQFHKSHKYCGACGAVTIQSTTEDARTCPSCSQVFYPRLSPVVIMRVFHAHELLLARSPHFKKGMYSCLAGFIEPGETAEEAVSREVMEETGISIKNIRYVTSQPWPFPHSLMLGFSAEFNGGDLHIDPKEIEDAAWFSPETLPQIPVEQTIGGYLIRDFIKNVNKKR